MTDGELAASAVAYFTPEEIASGHAFARARLLLFGARVLVTVLVLVLASRRGQPLRKLCSRLARGRPATTAVLLAIALLLAVRGLTLPLVYYGGFVLEHKYGLSNHTLGSFVVEYLKGQLLFAVPLGAAVAAWFTLFGRLGRRALPVLWLAALVAMVGVAAIAPLVVDPLFHRFRPVTDGDVLADVRELSARAGLHVDEVLEMDASRTTNRVNAYYTGLFGTRRVVLYDTLLAGSRRQVRLVLAHELGHWLGHHVAWGLALGAGAVALGLAILTASLTALGRRGGWGFARVEDPGAVAAGLLLALGLNLVALPIGNAVSRRFECQADRTSLVLTGDREGFVEAEQALARRNVADHDPAPPEDARRHEASQPLARHPADLRRPRGALRAPLRPVAREARQRPGARPSGYWMVGILLGWRRFLMRCLPVTASPRMISGR